MQEKKRIALITTWFPPQQGIATNRMVAFAEYLSEDYEIEVFGLADNAYSSTWKNDVNVHYLPSNKLLNKLKSSTKDGALKHKFKTFLRVVIGKIVRNPMNGWRVKTTAKFFKRHQEKPFDLIISSFSPQEAHLVAIDCCKAFPGLPWIADMRDEMSFNPNHSPALNEWLRTIELEIDQYASAVTSVSEPILSIYKEHLPNIQHAVEIRNGFNHDLHFDAPSAKAETAFRFGYFGSFYGAIKPEQFFKALSQLPEKTPFEVHIYGAHANFSIPSAIKDHIWVHPPLSYENAVLKMREMDANVVIHPTSDRKGVYTGKLFDYISVRKPVLALMDETDVAAQLVHQLNCGYVRDNADTDGVMRDIQALFEDREKGTEKAASAEATAELHRSHGVKKLKELIERILS